MEHNVTRDFLAAMLTDPQNRRPSPDWLTSARLYRRPEFAKDVQDSWPRVQGSGDVEAAQDAPPVDVAGSPVVKPSRPDIGMGRAASLGAFQGISAEFGDELAGGYAAGSTLGVNTRRPVGMALQMILGLARVGYDSLRGERGAATEAYEGTRDQVRADTETAKEQYPVTYYTGNIGAGLAVPASKVAQAATIPVRMGRGAAAAGLFGGLSGVGSGETLTDRAIQGVIGAATGSVLGAGMGAVAPVIAEGATRVGSAVAKGLRERFSASPGAMGVENTARVRASTNPLIL